MRKVTTIRVKGFDAKEPEVDDPTVFRISPDCGLVDGPTVSTAAATSAPPKDTLRRLVSIAIQSTISLFIYDILMNRIHKLILILKLILIPILILYI